MEHVFAEITFDTDHADSQITSVDSAISVIVTENTTFSAQNSSEDITIIPATEITLNIDNVVPQITSGDPVISKSTAVIIPVSITATKVTACSVNECCTTFSIIENIVVYSEATNAVSQAAVNVVRKDECHIIDGHNTAAIVGNVAADAGSEIPNVVPVISILPAGYA